MQIVFPNSRVNSTAEGKSHFGAVIGSTEYCDERFRKRLGQPTYHFVRHCRNTTASNLFSICQCVQKQT